LSFNTKLLGDPDSNGPEREREWSRLFHAMTPRLRHFFARRVAFDELDDLIAKIWQRAVLRIGALDEPDALWSWLVTIGVNLVKDGIRTAVRQNERLGRQTSLDEMKMDERIAERLAGDFLVTTQLLEGSKLVRESVSDSEWELLQLWAIDDLTHAEIADRMSLASAVASRQQVSRLCRRLREQLASAIKEVA
jgi:RNA polymerase sigma factor (sigma-70 family)